MWESDWTRSILETPRPRGPHPLASVVMKWWEVRAAKVGEQLTNDRDRAKILERATPIPHPYGIGVTSSDLP